MVPESTAVQRALAQHREALAVFVAVAAAVAPDAYNRAPAAEKWSPAQVVEHIRLSYGAITDELERRGGFRVRTPWWRQRLLQWFVLPRILRTGQMPRGVPAVREIRPADGPYDQAVHLASLQQTAEDALTRIAAHDGDARATLAHPFLGHVPLADGVALATHHLRHHQGQLPGA
ncbi:MAG: DinB family protein [Gemmatimonadetes bacterium]|nr:DinB family protein [Gemmatimonadota bacterium]